MRNPNFDIVREQSWFIAKYKKPASEQTGLLLAKARDFAVLNRSGAIGSEHLLFGLADLGSAEPLFEYLKINPIKAICAVNLTVFKGNPSSIADDVDYTSRSRKILGLATEQSNNSGGMLVTPYDVALGMTAEREGVAGRVLEALGADFARIQRAITMLGKQS